MAFSSSFDREFFEKTLNKMDQSSLVAVGEIITKTIDFQQYQHGGSPSIQLGIDKILDKLKRYYDGMNSFLAEVADSITKQLPSWASRYVKSCIFLPQVGFLLAIELDDEKGRGKYYGEESSSGPWEQFFIADGAVHYKNNAMRHLDEQFGDIYCKIGDREVEILHHLASQVIRYEDALISASDACGDIDAILSLALAAEKFKWTAPKMTNDHILRIKNGRHPLLEFAVSSYIPNDCVLPNSHGQENSSTLVLTGPNQSGKSVFLKQVALIVYLAHIGSFVPAEMAVIGMIDRIVTRISTQESIFREDSAFSFDLKQLLHGMQHLTPRSLLIVDEFGKGTNTDDGAGLLASFLEYLRFITPNGPRCLVSTHLHETFEETSLFLTTKLHFAHMEVAVVRSNDAAETHLTYLFKVRYGYSSTSFGCYCANLNGVPSTVVDKANVLSHLLSRNEDIRVHCARLSAVEEAKLQKAEDVARKFLEEDFQKEANNDEARGSHARYALQKLLLSQEVS